jgi:hypothetical protein
MVQFSYCKLKEYNLPIVEISKWHLQKSLKKLYIFQKFFTIDSNKKKLILKKILFGTVGREKKREAKEELC